MRQGREWGQDRGFDVSRTCSSAPLGEQTRGWARPRTSSRSLSDRAGVFNVWFRAGSLARCELTLERATRAQGRLLELLAQAGFLLMLVVLHLKPAG